MKKLLISVSIIVVILIVLAFFAHKKGLHHRIMHWKPIKHVRFCKEIPEYDFVPDAENIDHDGFKHGCV
jgi:hypothetical protein